MTEGTALPRVSWSCLELRTVTFETRGSDAKRLSEGSPNTNFSASHPCMARVAEPYTGLPYDATQEVDILAFEMRKVGTCHIEHNGLLNVAAFCRTTLRYLCNVHLPHFCSLPSLHQFKNSRKRIEHLVRL